MLPIAISIAPLLGQPLPSPPGILPAHACRPPTCPNGPPFELTTPNHRATPSETQDPRAQEPLSGPKKIDSGRWRYETGKRMRAMERAWAAAEERHRGEAVSSIERSVAHFFRGNMAGVARELDGARRKLEPSGEPPTELQLAADAFAILPESSMVPEGAAALELSIAPIYGEWELLDGASISLSYLDAGRGVECSVQHPYEKAGPRVRLDLEGHASGPFTVSGTLELKGQVVSIGSLDFEIIPNLEARLAVLKDQVGQRRGLPRTIAAHTAHGYLKLLQDIAKGQTPETDYSTGALLEQAESLAAKTVDPEATVSTDWISSPGDRWLALPIGRRTVDVRVFVPEDIDPGTPAPLVVALHGAGGSHNMFFDGYGDGLAVELARTRGWILVAPKVGFFSCPVVDIVDTLVAHLPADPERVFVVGHSMGAGAALRAVNENPSRFVAIAALGGGGRATKAAASIPAFLGAGASDFGKRGVDTLASRLKALGATGLIHRTYDHTEHLLIVQRALPDVFEFFDTHLAPR